MASPIVRLVLQNQSQFLVLGRKSMIGSRFLSTTCLRSNSVPSPNVVSESSYSVPPTGATTATTGWEKARYPQEELVEMHRRAAKTEDPKLERRRRLHFVKLIIAIGASFVGPLSLLTAILMWGRHDITYHGIW